MIFLIFSHYWPSHLFNYYKSGGSINRHTLFACYIRITWFKPVPFSFHLLPSAEDSCILVMVGGGGGLHGDFYFHEWMDARLYILAYFKNHCTWFYHFQWLVSCINPFNTHLYPYPQTGSIVNIPSPVRDRYACMVPQSRLSDGTGVEWVNLKEQSNYSFFITWGDVYLVPITLIHTLLGEVYSVFNHKTYLFIEGQKIVIVIVFLCPLRICLVFKCCFFIKTVSCWDKFTSHINNNIHNA